MGNQDFDFGEQGNKAIHFRGTQEQVTFKLGTHMDNYCCIVYAGVRLLMLIHLFIIFIFLSLQFPNIKNCRIFSSGTMGIVRPTTLKRGTHMDRTVRWCILDTGIRLLVFKFSLHFYASNIEEVKGAYWFGPVRPSVRPRVRYVLHRSRTVRDMILKSNIWNKRTRIFGSVFLAHLSRQAHKVSL